MINLIWVLITIAAALFAFMVGLVLGSLAADRRENAPPHLTIVKDDPE